MKELEVLNKAGESETVPVNMSSKQWIPNVRDTVQSALLAAITGGLNAVYATLATGSLNFNWKQIGISAGLVFIGNILRKLPQESKVVIKKSDLPS